MSETAGHPFLVMELLNGKTLSDRIGGKPLEIPAAVALSLQVADVISRVNEARCLCLPRSQCQSK